MKLRFCFFNYLLLKTDRIFTILFSFSIRLLFSTKSGNSKFQKWPFFPIYISNPWSWFFIFRLNTPQRVISNISKIQNHTFNIRVYILNSNEPLFCQFLGIFGEKYKLLSKRVILFCLIYLYILANLPNFLSVFDQTIILA